MLEIVAQILSAMLALGGINFIVQALFRLSDINAGALILSLVAGILSIGTAIYFYNAIDSQSDGVRKAINEIQQLAPPVEPVSPY